MSPPADIKPWSPERFNCLECTYTCYSSQHLELHSSIHRSLVDTKLTYYCKQCPFRCAATPTLKAHMRGHPGRHVLRHYLCTYCGVQMSDKDNIETHLEKEHLIYSCSYDAVRDVVIGDEGPPKCLLCNEQFSLYSTLLQHIETQHGENGVNKHTAEGVLLFDDCQVPVDIKTEEHQTEPIAKLQVHVMSPHEASKVYQTLTSSETTKCELEDNDHVDVSDDVVDAIRYEIYVFTIASHMVTVSVHNYYFFKPDNLM